MVMAPASRAIFSRSGTILPLSMAMTRPALSSMALRMANCPTGPQPQIATVSSGWTLHCSTAM